MTKKQAPQVENGIVNRAEKEQIPGTIESYSAAFVSSLGMLILLWLGGLGFVFAVDIPKDSAVKIFKTLMSENFGHYSFVSAALVTIVGNSFYLLSTNTDSIRRMNTFRLHVQSYLTGLFGTVFAIGFWGMSLLEVSDYGWTFLIMVLVWGLTFVTDLLKNGWPYLYEHFGVKGAKNGIAEKWQSVLGIGYLVILMAILFWSGDIFKFLSCATS